MGDQCPYIQGDMCKLTQINIKEDGDFFKNTCSHPEYLKNCPNLTRKVYAAKTYHFIGASRSCPYIYEDKCDLTKYHVCKKHKSFYDDTCCTSKYYDKCSYFCDKVITIKPNRYFKPAYRCPYLINEVCELRGINMYEKNRAFYRHNCINSNYHKNCPYYLEKIGKIKYKHYGKVSDCCDYKDGDWCRLRKIKIKDSCKEFYEYACCKKNYIKCCPHYVEAAYRKKLSD
ncbi:hypothetical protein JCM14036_05790 [Desulfotomaculum defluvii]